MADCLQGCGRRYDCGNLQKAIDADIVAPIVIATVTSPEGGITVGNRSAPSFSNHAAIKSFQYGMSDGIGCTIEIVDEEGGSFPEFFGKVANCLENAADKYLLKVRWGWLVESCFGMGSPILSSIHTFLIKRVSVNMENGIFRFVLEGIDLIGGAQEETRAECTYGADDDPMPLKEAIKKLFKNYTPPVSSVKFLRVKAGGGTEDWDFKKINGEVPKGVWQANQTNPLSTALEWMRPFQTEREKGVVPAWNDTASQPEIIFWEDYSPSCDEQLDGCSRSKGTYIVNGGDCSRVISFKPEINWTFAVAANVGGIINEGQAKGEKQAEEQECQLKAGEKKGGGGGGGKGCAKGGVQTEQQTPDTGLRNYGNKEATKETIKSDQKHQRANRTYEPVKAELVIQGDPVNYDRLDQIKGKLVSVVYINPFHVIGGGSSCDWLQISNCNSVLSNKGWDLLQVAHDIQDGSYTTTLSLFLTAPGSNVSTSLNLGSTGEGFRIRCS